MKNQDSHPKWVAVPELMVATRIVEAETLRFHSRLRVLHGVESGVANRLLDHGECGDQNCAAGYSRGWIEIVNQGGSAGTQRDSVISRINL